MRCIILLLLLAGPVYGQSTGFWKMNPDKSTHDDDQPLPNSIVMRIEPHLEGEIETTWSSTHDGRSETVSLILRNDGKDYPHPLHAQFDSVNTSKLAGGAIKVLYKKDGKIVGQQLRQLTADGQQMTIHFQFLSKTGKWLKQVVVFEKQKE